jgi:Pectate lyase superfamily protein
MIRFARILTVGLLCCMPVWATVRNVQTCGATGNGTTDDTAAINSCIGQLVAGDTLLFPAGTYKITSALTAIRANNVEVSGSSGAA